MAKTKDEIKTNGRAVFYTIFWESFRKAALERGWTLALHGSMASDMDIIAVPWVDDACPASELVSALSDCLGETMWKDHHFRDPTPKSHGRVVYTLSIFSDYYIDLSVIPPKST